MIASLLGFNYFEKIDPKGYSRYRRKQRNSAILIGICFAAIVTCLVLSSFHGGFLFALPFLLLFAGILANLREEREKEAVQANEKCQREYEIRQKDRDLEYQARIADNTAQQAGAMVMMSEKQAHAAGQAMIHDITVGSGARDVQININAGTGDFLVQAVKTVETNNEPLAAALTTIAGALRDVKDEEALETLRQMNKKIAQGEDKLTIKALWNHLLKLVPDLAKMTEAVATMTKVFT
jgi:hypothetical protein